MRDARRGAFDVVVVWRFDRFARSVKQLVVALEIYPAMQVGVPVKDYHADVLPGQNRRLLREAINLTLVG